MGKPIKENPSSKFLRKCHFLSLKKTGSVLQLQNRHIFVSDSIKVVHEVDNEEASNNISRINVVNHETLPDAVDKVA